MTDAIKHLLRNRPIYAFKFEGQRFDAGGLSVVTSGATTLGAGPLPERPARYQSISR